LPILKPLFIVIQVGIGARDNYDFVDFLYGTVVASVTLGYGDVHPEGIMTQLTIYGYSSHPLEKIEKLSL
jgi:hypothetical protein